MRRVSPTNARTAEDKDYRETYMEHAFDDELLRYFPLDHRALAKIPGFKDSMAMYGKYKLEPHHIFGGRMGRWDKEWNLLAVCRPVHEFCERWKTDGRILALRRKVDAGEWDSEDAWLCLKMHPLGWMHGVKCEHEFAERIRVELCRAHDAKEIG